jgi:hypothetical protein
MLGLGPIQLFLDEASFKKIHHLMMFRSDPKYLTSLGQSVINIIRLVPHGVLIFFPSYRFSFWGDLQRACRSVFKFVSFCAVFFSKFFAYYFLKVHTSDQSKRSHKIVEIKAFLTFFAC